MRTRRYIPRMRYALLCLVAASCGSAPPAPSTLDEFEAHSAAQASERSVADLTGIDPVANWALLLWVTRGVVDPEANPGDTSLFLNGVTELDVDRARVLAASPHDRIFLPDVTELSPEAAAVLASAQHELFLDGLRTISTETARALGSGRSERLSLNGLTNLSRDAAAALAELDGSLHLTGLAAADVETLRALAGWKGWNEQVILHLGLVDPSEDDLRTLATIGGWGVALDQIRELTPDRARALATIVRPSLSLNGVTSMSDEVAEVMAGWRAKFLELNRLQELSPEQRALIEQGCEVVVTRSVPPPG